MGWGVYHYRVYMAIIYPEESYVPVASVLYKLVYLVVKNPRTHSILETG